MTDSAQPQSGNWLNVEHNLVELGAISAANILALLRGNPFPAHLLLPFVHESTHHRCFLAVVGTSIAAVHLRARELLSAGERAAAAKARHKALLAQDALRPVSEGLAVLAEFTEQGARSIRELGPLFLGSASREEVLASMLIEERLSQEAQDRLCSHLCQPDDGRHPYGLGFKVIHALFARICSTYPPFAERHLAIRSLELAFFGDYVLAATILTDGCDDSVPTADFARKIATYVVARVQSLFEADLAQVMADLDLIWQRAELHVKAEHFVATQHAGEAPYLFLSIDKQPVVERAYRTVGSMLEDYGLILRPDRYQFRVEPYDPWDANLRRIPVRASHFFRRGFIQLGDVEVWARPARKGHSYEIFHEGEYVGSMPWRFCELQAAGCSHLSAYYFASQQCLVLVLRRYDRMTSYLYVGQNAAAEIDEVIAQLRHLDRGKEYLLSDIEEQVRGDLSEQSERDEILRNVDLQLLGLLPNHVQFLDGRAESRRAQYEPKGMLSHFSKVRHFRVWVLNLTCDLCELGIARRRRVFAARGLDFGKAVFEAMRARRALMPGFPLPGCDWFDKTRFDAGKTMAQQAARAERQGDLGAAMRLNLAALELAQEACDSQRVAILYQAIGELCRRQSNWVESERWLNWSLELRYLNNNLLGLGYGWRAKARLAVDKKLFIDAFFDLNAAQGYFRKANETRHQAVALYEMKFVAEKLNDDERAEIERYLPSFAAFAAHTMEGP